MTKTIHWIAIMSIAAVLVSATAIGPIAFADDPDEEDEVECDDERTVSETTTFSTRQTFKSGSGEFIVVLDTTGSGTLCVVHVALTAPCDKANFNNAASVGDSKPKLSVLAGVADIVGGGALAPVINSAAQDTGFRGPGFGTMCIFHGTITPAEVGGPITDIILGGAGFGSISLSETTITVTGTYAED